MRYPKDVLIAASPESTTYDLARRMADAAYAKKAADIVIVDLRSIVAYTDYLVIATGQTPRQTKAISEEIRKVVKEDTGVFARRTEGEREAEWILMDFIDVVAHIFTPQARDFYRLERLWREAPLEEYAPQEVTVNGVEHT